MNRRSWIKSSVAATAGLAAGPLLLNAKGSPNRPNFPWRIYEQNLQFTPRMEDLRARLLANENPYGPSPKARQAILESVGLGNRYGHGYARKLISKLAELEGVTPDHILLGPGSTDLLEKIAITTLKDGGNVVTGDPAYMSVVNTARAFKAEWNPVPLMRDYAHDLTRMEQAIDSDTKLIYICNPNNPTGTLTPHEDLRSFCRQVSAKVPVFVDEAYVEFLDNAKEVSMIDLIHEGKDVIITRTFSKIHGMAGLRIGYMIAQPSRVEAIDKMVRTTMGLCVTTLKGAMASLEDVEFQNKSRDLTAQARKFTYDLLTDLGLEYIPSHTSFMMFPLEMPGKDYLDKMFSQGVGVRVFVVDGKPWCRVSMGTLEEMATFGEALKKVLS